MTDTVTMAAKVPVSTYNAFIDKLNKTEFTITDLITYMAEDFANGTYDPVKTNDKYKKIQSAKVKAIKAVDSFNKKLAKVK